MPETHKPNWDDLRFVLAVAETGTVNGAARRLGVNHATVLRRIAACEDRFGVAFFDRGVSGYSVRADRLRMLEALREVETAMQSAENLIRGASAPLTGTVRVTSTDTFCQHVLPPILNDIRTDSRRLKLVLLNSNLHLDFSRAHADIAVRPAVSLAEDMVGEAVAHLGFAVYAGRGDAEGWLGLEGQLRRTRAAEWMAAHVREDEIVASADSFLVLAELVGAGLGRAAIPCVIGDATPGLRRMRDLPEVPAVPVWVACHTELATVPRIVEVRSKLAAALKAKSGWLAGEARTGLRSTEKPAGAEVSR